MKTEEGLEDDIMFGDFDFCVRPKGGEMYFVQEFKFYAAHVWCNLSGQLILEKVTQLYVTRNLENRTQARSPPSL